MDYQKDEQRGNQDNIPGGNEANNSPEICSDYSAAPQTEQQNNQPDVPYEAESNNEPPCKQEYQPSQYPQKNTASEIISAYQNYSEAYFRRKQINDIRKKEAAKAANRMALLSASQTGFADIWQQVLMAVMIFAGMTITYMDLNYFWLTALLVPLATLLPFFIYILVSKSDLQQMIKFQHHDAINTVFGIVIAMGICMFANIPANILASILEAYGYHSYSSLPEYFNLNEFLLYTLGVAVLAPLIEEFIFRGIVISRLEKHGKGFAIFTSAVIFGLAHSNIVSVVFAFIAGLAFGWLYIKTRNLWVSIFVHFLNNMLSIFQSYSSIWFSNQANEINSLLMLAPMVLALVGLVFMLLFYRKKFFTLSVEGENQQPEMRRYYGISYLAMPLNAGETISALFHTPGFWIMVAISLYKTSQYFVLV